MPPASKDLTVVSYSKVCVVTGSNKSKDPKVVSKSMVSLGDRLRWVQCPCIESLPSKGYEKGYL